jgi:hypothetical protein
MQSDGVASARQPWRSSFQKAIMMQNFDVRVEKAIWASTILPGGIVRRWFIADGAIVESGAKIAEIRIEGALHEIDSPASGHLPIVAAVNNVVEHGSLQATPSQASIDAHARI